MIRRLKFSYLIYNLFSKRRLIHNVPLYKKLRLRKYYFSPISSKDFANLDPAILKSNSEIKPLKDTALFNELSKDDQQSLMDFEMNGFSILKGFVNKESIDQINSEIDQFLKTGKIGFKYANKIMFAYKKIESLRRIAEQVKLREVLSALLSDNAVLFQSINFIYGSEQETHSDSIHMTTFPLGGLLGVWVALEDIDIDNGPLHYYPGSHKLPYYLNADYDNEGNFFQIGDKEYSEYEKMIRSKIAEFSLEKKTFHAKAGDVLIWHANLFHGGEEHTNKNKSRKSVVFHYYAQNRICYHEITQRPALFEERS